MHLVVSLTRIPARFRLPDHHPSRPEPSITLGAAAAVVERRPRKLIGGDHDPMRYTGLAALMGRIGSTRSWAEVCADLGLPDDHAAHLENLIGTWVEAGLWPDIRNHLDRLMTGLQRHPPPIDYQARRKLGDDLDLFSEAVVIGQRRHPTDAESGTMLRQFWERLTGSDIAHAPEPLRLDSASSASTTFRSTLGVRHADVFHLPPPHQPHRRRRGTAHLEPRPRCDHALTDL